MQYNEAFTSKKASWKMNWRNEQKHRSQLIKTLLIYVWQSIHCWSLAEKKDDVIDIEGGLKKEIKFDNLINISAQQWKSKAWALKYFPVFFFFFSKEKVLDHQQNPDVILYSKRH